MTEAPRTVWVTKYALTSGVRETDVLRMDGSITSVRWDAGFTRLFLSSEWHPTREAALARAEEMRAAKIASLKRQIERLESLEF